MVPGCVCEHSTVPHPAPRLRGCSLPQGTRCGVSRQAQVLPGKPLACPQGWRWGQL